MSAPCARIWAARRSGRPAPRHVIAEQRQRGRRCLAGRRRPRRMPHKAAVPQPRQGRQQHWEPRCTGPDQQQGQPQPGQQKQRGRRVGQQQGGHGAFGGPLAQSPDQQGRQVHSGQTRRPRRAYRARRNAFFLIHAFRLSKMDEETFYQGKAAAGQIPQRAAPYGGLALHMLETRLIIFSCLCILLHPLKAADKCPF